LDKKKESLSRDVGRTSSANSFLKLWKKTNMDGIGVALIVVIDADTNIAFHLVTDSREMEEIYKSNKKKLISRKR
jgi:hypothetical protein